jgi:rhodanese-related sulfurtransferase
MKKAYIILALIIIVLGLGLIFLPEIQHKKELPPKQLLTEISTATRFISTDKVAERIIDGDPSMLLVDVRDMYQSLEFTLPGAINIPIEEVLDSTWMEYFDQDDYDVVLFSNGDILADQAYMVLRRYDYKNLFVLKGGLNYWAETILQPPVPSESAPTEEFELYDFRRAARQYFVGGDVIIEQQPSESITVTRRKKKNVVEGGC